MLIRNILACAQPAYCLDPQASVGRGFYHYVLSHRICAPETGRSLSAAIRAQPSVTFPARLCSQID
jgi:hypothetical protein